MTLHRELRTEIGYHVHSRSLVLVTLLMIGGAVLAFYGSLSNAYAANRFFVAQVNLYEENGVDITEALSAPTGTTIAPDGAEVIDNPLKHDYLAVGEALHAISGPGPMLGTVLDLVTFVVIPMVFIFFGAHVATFDRRFGTLKQRAARSPLVTIVSAKLLSLAVMALAAVATLVVTSLALSVAGSIQVSRMLDSVVTYTVVDPVSVSPVAVKVLMTFGVAVFFGALGYAVGALTNSTSWPMVLAAATLFVLPFQGTWDPRNLVAALGTGVYDFWGQFDLRPPVPVGDGAAILALLAYLAVALVVAFLAPRPSKRFR